MAKPQGMNRIQLESFLKNDLPIKIKIASIAKVGARKRTTETVPVTKGATDVKDMVIAIGASTGGTEATAEVLRGFGPDIPGVVVVQHMPVGFTEMYAKRLDNQGALRVKEARSGDMVVPGQVLIAPGGDTHMELIKVNGNYQVVLKKAPKVNGHCPSVDVLFQSVAKMAGSHAIGIILTGMGGDGANGLLAMRKTGAHTIGQDESTCVVYGMPKVAYDIGAVEYQEKLSDVAKRTYSLLGRM